VQLAQLSGAEVFATAGNPEKRATLQALGVRHVFDSRSLDFTADVLAATDGRGVDLVLNSLSGDFIPRSLDVLAPGGRFLEIGKRDIWTADQVADIRPDVEYSIVFLGDLSLDDPPAIRAMLGELLPRFVDGSLRPLPRTTFDVDEVVDAFRFMAQARHTGKIVVRQRDDSDGAPVRPDVTYLITGGLGGLGLRIAQHLIDRGARHLALVGRSDVDASAAATIAELGDRGAHVSTFRADVGRRSDVSDLLTDIEAKMPPLRGIIHAAGVNDDAVLSEQSWVSFEAALGPKLAGGWHLHDLTRGMELDLFVLFSSAAAVLGAPGQANYAAANAFLDSLAAARGADSGLARSIGWGPWDDLGMTARLDARDLQRMERRGIVPLSADDALAVFDRVAFDADIPAYVLAIDLDAAALDDRPVLAALRRSATSPVASSSSHGLLQQWIDTVPGMRRTTIAAFVVEQARTVLGLSAASAIAPRRPFNELGLDSLMAVELRNAVGAALGRPQPATLLFDHPTTDTLVEHLLALVEASAGPTDDPGATADPNGGPPAADTDDIDVAALTEQEAEALLLAELGGSESSS
jgi:NADPH:quinone reductase-like Zn-dependent oxidoreductase/acyl carrier protein